MSHIWMSHVTHMNESCHTCEWVMSHIWMTLLICMKEPCHINDWAENAQCHVYECAMNEQCHCNAHSYIWMSSVIVQLWHINVIQMSYKWLKRSNTYSYIWMRNEWAVSLQCAFMYMNAQCVYDTAYSFKCAVIHEHCSFIAHSSVWKRIAHF